MSDKTLGQIDVDEIAAKYAEILFMHGHTDRVMNMAVYRKFIPIGIDMMESVARHVFGELMSAHLAEHHAKPVEPEPAWKYTSGTVSSEPAKTEPDWAMEEAQQWYGANDTEAIRLANSFREAAERHYGEMVESLDRQMKELEQERDVAQCNATELGKSLLAMTDERDAARAECERLRAALKLGESKCDWTLLVGPNLTPVAVAKDAPPPAAVAGDDELRDKVFRAMSGWLTYVSDRGLKKATDAVMEAIRPLFDAVRAERDEALKQKKISDDCIPDKCPITGLPFFMAIERDGKWHATYGGPFDSYTIPALCDADPDSPEALHERGLLRRRYDHDLGGWLVDEFEEIDVRLIEREVAECDIEELKQRAEAAEAELIELRAALADRDNYVWLTGDGKYFSPSTNCRYDSREECYIAAHRAAKGNGG